MERLGLIRGLLFVVIVACVAVIAWDLVQSGALPDPVETARDLDAPLQQSIRELFQGVLG